MCFNQHEDPTWGSCFSHTNHSICSSCESPLQFQCIIDRRSADIAVSSFAVAEAWLFPFSITWSGPASITCNAVPTRSPHGSLQRSLLDAVLGCPHVYRPSPSLFTAFSWTATFGPEAVPKTLTPTAGSVLVDSLVPGSARTWDRDEPVSVGGKLVVDGTESLCMALTGVVERIGSVS